MRQLIRGMEQLLFDGDTVQAGLISEVFAVPRPPGGIFIIWRQKYGTTPGAIQVNLEAAQENDDTQFAQLDVSSEVGGEIKHIGPTLITFIRAKIISVTGGDTITVGVKVG